MALRDVIKALKTPDWCEEIPEEKLLDRELSFSTARANDLHVLSVYTVDDSIVVDVG